MISVNENLKKETFLVEEEIAAINLAIPSSCSCGNPTRMYWFTPNELSEEEDND